MYIANNNNQNSNNEKIILVKKSDSISTIKNVAKSLMLLGAGWGAKYIYDMSSEKESSAVFNGEILDYFYKRLSTKPNSWTYSPRYYIIKFLNSIINYDNKKSTDDDINLIVKYLILATLPTNGKTSEEQMFGAIISSILKEVADNSDNIFFKKLFVVASYKNSLLARLFALRNIDDIKFLNASPNILYSNNNRLNFALNKININKKEHGKFLERLSNNIKKHFNESAEKCKNKTPNKKLIFNSSDDAQLSGEDKIKIFNLSKDSNINKNITKIINFDAYQLSVLLFDLLFRATISQTFDVIHENKNK